MKTFFTITVIIIAHSAFGQWAPNGNNIYNTNTGGVGIGTSSPSGKLDINWAGGQLRLSGGTVPAGVWTNATDLLYLGDWQTGTKGLLINLTSGNVGIGAASPNEKLEVKGNLRITGNSEFGHSELQFYRGSGTKFASIGQSDLNVANSPFDIREYNGNDIRFLTSGGLERLRILSSNGSVGIGTSSPLSKLHINSSIERETFRIYKQGNTANYLSIWQGTGGCVIDPIATGLLHLGYDQSTNVIMGYTGAGANSGNVGIGTPNPDAKLAVKGQIHAQEVKVDLNGAVAPDYVFASNYQLPTLDYIKAYIDQNKHLPEVPSAKEMEANGVKLGEMNMLLLKKIEELTLYQIEANRKYEELYKEAKFQAELLEKLSKEIEQHKNQK